MLYLCIPVHNEAPTVGLLLWRIRKVFQQYSREYELIVYNDGSTDATAEVLAGYMDVLPLTVLGSAEAHGYAHALESCCREADSRSRYPRRDALVVMQADFTDTPEQVPELVRRFEGGADIVTAERAPTGGMPAAARRLRAMSRWLIGARAKALGTLDPLSGFRLYRIALIRELLKGTGPGALLSSHGTAANLELFLAGAKIARRLESVSTTPRYDLRQRPSRLKAAQQAIALFRISRNNRAPIASR